MNEIISYSNAVLTFLDAVLILLKSLNMSIEESLKGSEQKEIQKTSKYSQKWILGIHTEHCHNGIQDNRSLEKMTQD